MKPLLLNEGVLKYKEKPKLSIITTDLISVAFRTSKFLRKGFNIKEIYHSHSNSLVTRTYGFHYFWSDLSYNYPINFRYTLKTTTPELMYIITKGHYLLHRYLSNVRHILTHDYKVGDKVLFTNNYAFEY